MSDRADKPLEQSPLARLAERQVVQFISDALRARQTAILVTGRGQVSMRVPEAALAACAGASARTLHIGPPLPEPPELQEMIGAAVEIAGGREMTPQAMARLLRFADPRPAVVLAIDEAHTLSHRSLSYLTLMTELLAPDAPILQIVLAAEPALLDTLAQPEFEKFRNRLCRPGFETFQTLHDGRATGAFTGLRKPAHGRATAGPALVQYHYTDPPSPRGHGIARAAVYAAGGVVAMGCLIAMGYIAFSAFTGPTLPPIPLPNSAAEQLGAEGNGDRAALSPNAAAPAPPIAAPDQNVDAAPPAILAKAAPTAPDGAAAVSPEQLGAEGNGDRAALSPSAAAPAPPIAAPEVALNFFPMATAQNRYNFADRAAPIAPDGAAASSAEQPGAVGNGDRAALSPSAAAPAPPIAAPDQNVDGAPPAILAKAAPTAPDGAAALSAEKLGAAGNGDRAALSPNAAAPAPPSTAPDPNVDVAPPAILAKAAPTAPDGAAARVVAGLPTLAPVRVVLNMARDDSDHAPRSADIQRALAAAGLEVSHLIPADAQQLGPSIGYYFQSDRNAAAEVSHLLEPLLGPVDPVLLRKRGSIPEPGTIEVAIPLKHRLSLGGVHL
jgi:hypothetical protein